MRISTQHRKAQERIHANAESRWPGIINSVFLDGRLDGTDGETGNRLAVRREIAWCGGNGAEGSSVEGI
jgi:hypothetical protein